MEQGTKCAPRRGWNAWGDVLYWGTRVGVYIVLGGMVLNPVPGLWTAPTGDIWVRLLLCLALLPYGALVVLAGGVLRGYCRMRATADGARSACGLPAPRGTVGAAQKRRKEALFQVVRGAALHAGAGVCGGGGPPRAVICGDGAIHVPGRVTVSGGADVRGRHLASPPFFVPGFGGKYGCIRG